MRRKAHPDVRYKVDYREIGRRLLNES